MILVNSIIASLIATIYLFKSTSAVTSGSISHLFEHSQHDDIELETMFANYVRQHGKSYLNSLKEYQLRRIIFKNNLAKIQKMNRKDLGSAKYGINKFSDMTDAEFKSSLGYKEMTIKRDSKEIPFEELWVELLKEEGKTEEELLISMPHSFDWRDHNGTVTNVKNQGSCGSCWSFATTGTIEGQYKINLNKSVSLSEQELIDCDHVNQGCAGGLPELAYDQVINLGGLATEESYPYIGSGSNECRLNYMGEKFTIDGFTKLPQGDENKMLIWLVKRGPISIAVNANTMQFYQAGIAHSGDDSCSKLIGALNHAILIVGYGSGTIERLGQHSEQQIPYWIVKNSWGSDWGESGYYRVYRGDNTCGLALDPTTAILYKKV